MARLPVPGSCKALRAQRMVKVPRGSRSHKMAQTQDWPWKAAEGCPEGWQVGSTFQDWKSFCVRPGMFSVVTWGGEER